MRGAMAAGASVAATAQSGCERLHASSTSDAGQAPAPVVVSRDRRTLRALVALVFVAGTLPGAINYAAVRHISLAANLTETRTQLAKSATTTLELIIIGVSIAVVLSRRARVVRGVSV